MKKCFPSDLLALAIVAVVSAVSMQAAQETNPPQQVTPESLQEQVLTLRGDWR